MASTQARWRQVGKQIESRVTNGIWDACKKQVAEEPWAWSWRQMSFFVGHIRHNVWCRAREKHREE